MPGKQPQERVKKNSIKHTHAKLKISPVATSQTGKLDSSQSIKQRTHSTQQ